MGMEYKLAVKIMDNVIKGYLKDREYRLLRLHDQRPWGYHDPREEELHADQIIEAYNRIRNG